MIFTLPNAVASIFYLNKQSLEMWRSNTLPLQLTLLQLQVTIGSYKGQEYQKQLSTEVITFTVLLVFCDYIIHSSCMACPVHADTPSS